MSVCHHPFLQVNDAGICLDCDASLTMKKALAPPSHIEDRIHWLTNKWEWVIGGVVDENPQYVRAIIHDFLGVPIPEHTYHTRDGMHAAEAERKRAWLLEQAEAELRDEGFYDS
jgi:hypothetical protein